MDKIKLLHGDCLELMKDIPDKSVDLILTDPPYGTTACKWDSVIPFGPMWEQYERVIKDNGAIVLTASQPFTSTLIMSNIKLFRYTWVWEKSKATGFLNAKKRPLVAHEDITVFSKKPTTYNLQRKSRTTRALGKSRQAMMFTVNLKGLKSRAMVKDTHEAWYILKQQRARVRYYTRHRSL